MGNLYKLLKIKMKFSFAIACLLGLASAADMPA